MVEIELTLWYAIEESEEYNWEKNITHEIKQAQIYGDSNIHWPLVLHLLWRRTEKVFQVGWSSPTTRMLVVLFFIFRRPYNMWTDYPNDEKKRSRIKHYLRELFYCLLKYSNTNIFCVGKMTVDYFVERGFSRFRLLNMPIPVETSKSKMDYLQHRERIRSKYHVTNDDFFLVAGSRLTYAKGYDLFIKALSILSRVMRERVKVLIIGEGNEKENLLQQIQNEGLTGNVFIEDWMDIEEYHAHISNADVFVHPARFDAYGGSIFAMALGVPVLGSSGAGAIIDNVESNVNGIIFQKYSVDSLSKKIAEIMTKNDLAELGTKMRQKMVRHDFKGTIHEKLLANLLG